MSLFKQLLREEWHIHASIVGNTSFALFALVVFGLCLAFAFVAPYIITHTQMMSFTHYTFLVFGLMIGAFGLGGREVLNRRFGEVSFLAYSSRTLPIGLHTIFANFIIKDIVYYSAFLVIPFSVALLASAAITPLPFMRVLVSLLTLPLSFLLGLSLSFLISTLYTRAQIIAQALLIIAVVLGFVGITFFLSESIYQNALGPLAFYLTLNPTYLVLTLCAIGAFLLAATLLFSFEHFALAKSYPSLFGRQEKHSLLRAFIIKDLIDLRRSQGGFGKIFFSFLIPLMIVEVMIRVLLNIFSVSNDGLLILFSVVIGITASTVYNWLTEFDLIDKYAFLPVSTKSILRAKTTLAYTIGATSGSFMLIISVLFLNASIEAFLLGLLVLSGVFAYTTNTLVLLTGLSPNILLFDAKIFMRYILFLAPVIIWMMFLSFAHPNAQSTLLLGATSLVLLFVSAIMGYAIRASPQRIQLIN
ncbi:hypothetical protein COT72_02245 [archaeon CG10_big_fil_rev_8_21_14_0_10_43_11]|nr:MAG: hypothetical protein COT72_02245 [archaeon CG10_big_fil_rev_8_21_14_0_10_43_11]